MDTLNFKHSSLKMVQKCLELFTCYATKTVALKFELLVFWDSFKCLVNAHTNTLFLMIIYIYKHKTTHTLCIYLVCTIKQTKPLIEIEMS